MHQLSKSHLCKNAKKKGLARSKKMHLYGSLPKLNRPSLSTAARDGRVVGLLY